MKRKLTENLKRITGRIHEACSRADRDPRSITLVAVTKSATLDVIRTLVGMGVADLGENRVQELTKRAAGVNEWLSRRIRNVSAGAMAKPNWHMVGRLQRNKVKALLPWVDMIHSVDSLRLAEEIDAQAAKIDRTVSILLEINVSSEPTKGGVAVAAATHLAEQITTLPHINLRGLMAMAPLTDKESVIRGVFERVRELFDEVVSERTCGPAFKELSLGMSNDFEYAIEFGATHVRIGSALLKGIELSAEPAPAS